MPRPIDNPPNPWHEAHVEYLPEHGDEVPLATLSVERNAAELRGGELNRTAFGERMHGEGPRWQAIEGLFAAHHRRLGFVDVARFEHERTSFRRPNAQLGLFEE